MFSSAEKTAKPATTVHRKAAQPFFGNREAASAGKPFFQPKLTVSQPGDKYEQEADATADKVMRMPAPASENTSINQNIQRKEEAPQEEQKEEVQAKLMPTISRMPDDDKQEETPVQAKALPHIQRAEATEPEKEEPDSGIPKVQTYSQNHHASISRADTLQQSGRGPPPVSPRFEESLNNTAGGTPLPPNTRQYMESRMGANFSGVRIHTGPVASDMSSQIQAQAFTYGSHIYFNSGKYDPESAAGKHLLAHELTHTVQQGASPVMPAAAPAAGPSPSVPASTASNTVSPKTATTIYRKPIQRAPAADGGADLSTLSGGRQLPDGAKEFLENQFSINVSDIRVFTNSDAADLCRNQGKRAITQGLYIALASSSYLDENAAAAELLSAQVELSLRQRNKIASNAPAALFSISSLIKEAAKANSQPSNPNEKTDPKDTAAKKKTPPSAAEKAAAKKAAADAKKAASKKKKKGAQEKTKLNFIKPKKGRSPASPQQDAQFLAVIKKGKQRATEQRTHEDAGKKSADAQAAAKAVPNEAESKAQERKTGSMDGVAQVETMFDEESFKKDLLQKIADVTPKNLEEADEFKDNNRIGEVKTAMGGKVADEKGKNVGPVEQANATPLAVNQADNKVDVSLPPTAPGAKPASIGATAAAPKPKTKEEVSMEEGSRSLDDEMKENNVTEDQLAKSNEPSFTKALDEKKTAQQDAVDKPKQFRKEEGGDLKKAKGEAQGQSVQNLAAMHGVRGKHFANVVSQQQTSKQKDEQERAAVVLKIEGMYQTTETLVNGFLDAAEKGANAIFDSGSEAARLAFEAYVDEQMRAYKLKRYSGFWGGLRWAKDKLFGMPDGVNKFYSDGREMYLKRMEGIISAVAKIVTLNLNLAKTAIKTGKKQISDYVDTLKGSLKNVGKEAAESIQEKFEALEQSVDDKRSQLIDGLAQKYVDNLKKLDDRINALKEANKGLVQKAIGFLKEVWKIIKNLKELFMTILARIADVIGYIIDAPGQFFSNLGEAFSQGFAKFQENLTTHLENGLMIWISSQLGVAGIQIPEKFDLPSLFGLALQVLGITKEHIRERAVALFGERKVKLMEKTADVFIRVQQEGLGALWDMIKEQIGNLKELIWEGIISYIKTSIVKAAFMFLLSLLNPIAAFIKACIAIYDFIMFLVRMKDQIIDFINSVLDAVMLIATGAVGNAAIAIEKALAKSIPIIIGFLAALLRLNGVGAKLRQIVMRIQKKVEKAIDWVLQKAYKLVGPAVDAAVRVYDKGEAMVTKGKEKAIEAAGKIGNWFKRLVGLEKKFTAEDGSLHRLYFDPKGQEVILMINPAPAGAYLTWVQNIEAAEPAKKAKKTKAIEVAKDIDAEKAAKVTGSTPAEKEAAEDEKMKRMRELVDQLSKLTGALFTGQKPPCSTEGNGLAFGKPLPVEKFGTSMQAELLTNIKMPDGSVPSVSGSDSFNILNQRKKGAGSYYVLGHLLNHNLGGTGKEWKNLTPLTREANSQHEHIAEARVKNAVKAGNIVYYEVKTVYDRGAAVNKDKKIQAIMNEEQRVPTKLICKADMITPAGMAAGDKEQRIPLIPKDTVINNNVEQEPDKYDLKGIKRDPVYLDSKNFDKINSIENADARLTQKIIDVYADRKKAYGTRFSSFDALADYEFSDDRPPFTDKQKTSILDMQELGYVKLFSSG